MRMKKFFTFTLTLVATVAFAINCFATSPEPINYVFKTSCGITVEIVVEGELTDDLINEYWIILDDYFCPKLNQDDDINRGDDINP